MKSVYNIPAHMHKKVSPLLQEVRAKYLKQIFESRENITGKLQYREQEKALLDHIAIGNVSLANELLASIDTNGASLQVGDMSESNLRQSVYLLVSCVTLFCRTAIDNGLPQDIAYSISDCYIQCADKLTDSNKIGALIFNAFRDYCQAMQDWNIHCCSKPLQVCCEYILTHMHSTITLKDLSKVCHLTPNYISDLFMKELGTRPTEYIRSVKLRYATYLLKNYDLSIAQIANLLAFPSSSRFTEHFKKQYGITPLKYRNQLTLDADPSKQDLPDGLFMQ